MISMTVAQVAEVVGGRMNEHCDPDAVVSGGVEFDSRKIGQGDIFIALRGERVDGHEFAVQATQQGAVVTLVYDDISAPAILVPPIPEAQRNTDSYAMSHDADGAIAAVLQAMGKLARYVVDTLRTNTATYAEGLTVLGVTGSAGKTSTKDMLAAVLRQVGPTVAPPGSFNNEIGHPYTALRCDESTQFLVAEMSARGVGHVASLAAIAPPQVGLVLNVGSAHLGEFGSQAVIAQAKGELVEALSSTGVAVLNADDPWVYGMRNRTDARVLAWSAAQPPHTDAAVFASDLKINDDACATFIVHTPAGSQAIELNVPGTHQVANALAVISACVGIGIDLETIATGLRQFQAVSEHRMDVWRAHGYTVIDDAYNANPESMRAGISAAAHSAKSSGGRLIAVLGPMGELGEQADSSHAELGAQLSNLGVEVLVAVDAPSLAQAAQETGVQTLSVNNNQEASAAVLGLMQQQDVLIAKASNAYRLWEVAAAVREQIKADNTSAEDDCVAGDNS